MGWPSKYDVWTVAREVRYAAVSCIAYKARSAYVGSLFIAAWLSWVTPRVGARDGSASLAVQPLILVFALVGQIDSGR